MAKPTGMSARVCARCSARRARRGFSLIELMVVIIIIGILAAMAVPSMIQARLDRNAYDDAGAIMQLFRNARTRSVARGGAVVISMTASTSDRGTFQSFEAVTLNETGVAAYQTPVNTCKAPTVWGNLVAGAITNGQTVQLVDGVNLNGNIEQDANIQTSIWSYSGASGTSVAAAWACFTPLGHVYFTTNIASPTVGTNPFDGVLPMVGPLELRVQRFSGTTPLGTTRSVLLPPSGMARIFSHT